MVSAQKGHDAPIKMKFDGGAHHRCSFCAKFPLIAGLVWVWESFLHMPVLQLQQLDIRFVFFFLAICCHSGCTVVSGVVVVVVVGVCNRSQMRTSKCTCLIFK